MNDLVKRLRDCSKNTTDRYMHELTGRAADRIEEQDKIIKNLERQFVQDTATIQSLEERLRVEQACNRCKQYHGKEPCDDVAELEAKLTDENSESWKDLYRKQIAITDQLNGHNIQLEAVLTEMGEDTRLGNQAIGYGTVVISNYLERLEEILGEQE